METGDDGEEKQEMKTQMPAETQGMEEDRNGRRLDRIVYFGASSEQIWRDKFELDGLGFLRLSKDVLFYR